MKPGMTIVPAFLVLLLSLGVSETFGCSWAIGYFHEVACLQGMIVGSNFPLLHSFRLFRQSVVRPKARLTLYDYCWPCDAEQRRRVKTVLTDGDGKFDFGKIAPGHYYLWIADEEAGLYDEFEVEVKEPINSKQSVMIDISPIYPDCTGGHEFIVREN